MIIKIVNFHTLYNAVVNQKDKRFAVAVDPGNLLTTHKEGTRRMKEIEARARKVIPFKIC